LSRGGKVGGEAKCSSPVPPSKVRFQGEGHFNGAGSRTAGGDPQCFLSEGPAKKKHGEEREQRTAAPSQKLFCGEEKSRHGKLLKATGDPKGKKRFTSTKGSRPQEATESTTKRRGEKREKEAKTGYRTVNLEMFQAKGRNPGGKEKLQCSRAKLKGKRWTTTA